MSLPSQFFNIPSGNSTYFQRLISSIYPTLSTDSQNAFITSITIGLSAGVNPSPSTILVALSSTSFFSIQQVQTWIGALTSNQVSSIITSSLLTTTGLTSSQIYTSSQLTTTITTTMLAASSIYQSTSNSYFVLTPWLSGLSTFFQYLTVSQLLGANILGYGILSNSIYRDVDGCNIKTTEGSPIVNYRDQFKIMPAPFMFANTYLGFPSNTYIVSIDTVNSTITMSQNATLTNDFGYNYITFGYTYVQAIMLYMFPSLSMLAQNNLLSILPSSSFFSFYPLTLTNIINQVYTQVSLPLSKSTYSSVFAAANIIGSFTTTQLQSSTYTGLTTTLLNMIPVITCTSPSVVSTLPTTNIINVSTAPTNGYPYVVTGYGILNTLVQATSYNANTSTLTLDTYCPIGPTPGIINTISFYTLTTTTMTTTLGSNQVVTGMGNVGWLGMFVYGNGIPYGTLIIFVTANTITLSQNATLTNTNTYYVYSQTPSFTATTNGTYTTSTVPVVNSSSISPGMIVTNNVPAGTIVTSTSLSLLSLSNSVTLSINTPLSFYSATVGNVTTLTPNLSTSIQLANADYSIVNGMSVLGFDIASGTTVTSMTTTGLITLSTPVVSTITPGISLVFYSPLSAFSPPPSSPGINAANSFFSNLNLSSFPSNICKIIFPIFSSLNISAQNNIIQSLIALQQVQLLTPAHLQGLTSSQIQVLTSSQFQLFNNTQYNTVLNKLSSTQFETLNLIPQSTLLNLLGMPSYTLTDLQKQTQLLVTYTADGTYTVPSGVYSLYIILNGGPGSNHLDSGKPNYPILNGFSANPILYCVSVYPGQVFNITLGTQGNYNGDGTKGKPTTFVSASNGVSYNGPGGIENGYAIVNSVVPISAYTTIYVNYTLNSFIPNILNIQLPVLTTTQIVSLTPSQLTTLASPPYQINYFTSSQIQIFTSTQLQFFMNVLTDTQIQSLTTQQIQSLSIPTIQRLSIFLLSTSQFQSIFSPSIITNLQLGSMTSAQIYSLTTFQLQSLNSVQIQSLTGIQYLTSSQLQSLTQNQVQVQLLTTTQTNLLTTTQVSYLTIGYLSIPQIQSLAALQGLTSTQIQSLTNEKLQSFTSLQIPSLTTQQMSYLSSQQIQILTNSEITYLSPLQLQVILPLLSTVQIQILTPIQIPYLTFSTSQIQYLTSTEITYLSSSQLQVILPLLSSPQLTYFTNTQIQLLTTQQLLSFTTQQIQAFTSTQLQSINNVQYNSIQTSLSTSQLELLNMLPQTRLLNMFGLSAITSTQSQFYYSNTQTTYQFVVPPSTYYLEVVLTGGSGGRKRDIDPYKPGFPTYGDPGATIVYVMSVYPGQLFNMSVGAQGTGYKDNGFYDGNDGNPTTFVSSDNNISYRSNGGVGGNGGINGRWYYNPLPVDGSAYVYLPIFTSTQTQGFTSSQFLSIQIQSLTTGQIQSLTNGQIQSLTTTQLQILSSNQYNSIQTSLSTTQIELLNKLPQASLLTMFGLSALNTSMLQSQSQFYYSKLQSTTFYEFIIPPKTYYLEVLLVGGSGSKSRDYVYINYQSSSTYFLGYPGEIRTYIISVYPGQVYNLTVGTQGTGYTAGIGGYGKIGNPTTFVSSDNNVVYNSPGGAGGGAGEYVLNPPPVDGYAYVYLPIFTTTQIQGLTSSEIRSLTTTQIRSLTTTQIRSLQTQYLTSTQLQSLTTTQI